jgi:hypothetical protein
LVGYPCGTLSAKLGALLAPIYANPSQLALMGKEVGGDFESEDNGLGGKFKPQM